MTLTHNQNGSLPELGAFLDAERDLAARRAELFAILQANIGQTISVEGVPIMVIMATGTRDGRPAGRVNIPVGRASSGKREPITVAEGTLLRVDNNGFPRRSEEISVGLPSSDIEVDDGYPLQVLGYAFPIKALRRIALGEPTPSEADA